MDRCDFCDRATCLKAISRMSKGWMNLFNLTAEKWKLQQAKKKKEHYHIKFTTSPGRAEWYLAFGMMSRCGEVLQLLKC